MTEENTEELRERLLGDEEVRETIARRAYEIYEVRGSEPGRETEDWLQAEGEVIPALVAEAQRAGESGDVSASLSNEAATSGQPEGRKAAG